jgi:hypothetical protein
MVERPAAIAAARPLNSYDGKRLVVHLTIVAAAKQFTGLI